VRSASTGAGGAAAVLVGCGTAIPAVFTRQPGILPVILGPLSAASNAGPRNRKHSSRSASHSACDGRRLVPVIEVRGVEVQQCDIKGVTCPREDGDTGPPARTVLGLSTTLFNSRDRADLNRLQKSGRSGTR